MEEIFDATDYKVAVKKRGAHNAKPWRWEIYRAGRSTPVFKSEKDYGSMTEATREGRNGLARFLAEIAA